MSTYKTVTVAGATGNLGPSIVNALVDAGFQVQAITRSGKAEGLPSSVKVTKVDYSSQDSLVSALRGQDAFVSAVPDHNMQPALIDAAITAGVKRFLPSEFGSDIYGNENNRKLPVFGGKVKTQEYLRGKQDQISYTCVVTGAFLDWGLKVNFIANVKDGKNKIYDGGDSPRTMSLLSDIGKAVVGVLQHPEETKNRAVYIQSAAVSQNQLLKLAKKAKPSLEIEIEKVDTAELEKKSYEILQKGENIMQAMFGFITVSIFRDGYGGLFAKTNNELFGIKELSEAEVEQVVAQYV